MSILIIVGTVAFGAVVSAGAYFLMRDTSSEKVTLIADKPQSGNVKIRDCPVEDNVAYWDEESNDKEPIPIVLDASKMRIVDGNPGYYVAMDHGDVYVPDFSQEEDVKAERIDAYILREEQRSTTIQDIADAADSNLQAMAKMMPYAAGIIIFLLIAVIVIVMR